MYSRIAVSKTKKAFWTAFGQYMKPVPSAEGVPVRWQNYKTGIKNVYFRLDARLDKASIAIEISHPDKDTRELLFDQFEMFKGILHQIFREEWHWELHARDEFGQPICRIYKELPGVSVMKEEDWPAIISFLKPRIMAMDEFWGEFKHGFEGLA
ncbi:DUF4268 domain-containing protein [Pleomorphovibrio marinus]|uniref:DUF4268 domain-containing protein n=1 Tax=Pleomorphovibrio marinus TaxID=2164132 RepID=UPI000E0C13A9|nr:DUF4268 domain-containing protein [Pleomorphovibrio marinus]